MREPKRLRKRPHWKGMPIPANVVFDAKGVPDFAALSHEKTVDLASKRLCALCGQRMGALVAFIGGKSSIEHRAFYDGPMHIDCATYAFEACPYVSGEHRELRESDREHTMPIVKQPLRSARPEWMAMLKTRRYRWDQRAGCFWAEPGVVVHEDELRGAG